MNRNLEDACAGSQLNDPGSSRRDCYGQSKGLGGEGNMCVQGANLQRLMTDALTFLKQVKVTFLDQDIKYDMFLEIIKDFKAQRTGITGCIARVKELFKGHDKLILGFKNFLPKEYEITLVEDETLGEKTVELEGAINLKNKIKSRFQKDENLYKSFLNILNLYRVGHKDIGEVYSEVAALFVDHPDLIKEFASFLPFAEQSQQNISHIWHPIQHFKNRRSATPMAEQMHIDKCNRRDRLLNSDGDLVTDYPELDNKIVVKVHKVQKRRSEKESTVQRNHDQVDTDCDNDKNGDYALPNFPKRKESVMKSKDFGTNFDLVPSQELDLSNCEHCTPSYRLLPDDYPIPSVTQRSEVGAQVLNDHWVAVASGSGDCSRKPKQRNQYEENLFQCEEARFELDMLLEFVRSAEKRVEELLSSIKENRSNINAVFRIEDHLTAQNLRCIERLYGDNYLDVIDILHGNPADALPVIWNRLKQKHEE